MRRLCASHPLGISLPSLAARLSEGRVDSHESGEVAHMKMLSAIGRFMAGPLGAVLICASVAGAIWYGLGPPGGDRPKAKPGGRQVTNRRSISGDGPDALRRDGST